MAGRSGQVAPGRKEMPGSNRTETCIRGRVAGSGAYEDEVCLLREKRKLKDAQENTGIENNLCAVTPPIFTAAVPVEAQRSVSSGCLET